MFILILGNMISIVLFDAGIELPPDHIKNHPAIINDAKRRGRRPDEILLYLPRHRFAMEKLENFEKRGRPDIIHRSLLLILDTPLNKMGLIKTYVETVNGQLIEFSSNVRLPKDFYQFEGLMVQLLKSRRVPPLETPLIWISDKKIEDLAKKAKLKVLFSEEGEKAGPNIWRDILENDSILLIGAFQKGEITQKYYELTDIVLSISRYPLMTTTVICKILTNLELTALNEGIIEEL